MIHFGTIQKTNLMYRTTFTIYKKIKMIFLNVYTYINIGGITEISLVEIVLYCISLENISETPSYVEPNNGANLLFVLYQNHLLI